jgi:dUTPase
MSEKPKFKFAVREDLADTGNLFLPTRAEPYATGWDVRAAPVDRKTIKIAEGQYAKIPLGIRGIPEPGWWYELKPRSSTFAKKHLHCLYGTIDMTFDQELQMAVCWQPDKWVPRECLHLKIEFGERIGQIIPVKLQEMDVEKITNSEYDFYLTQKNTSRAGFGSTGNK